MILDQLLRVSNAQALTAIAVSSFSIDLGAVTPKRQVGTGEPLSWWISVVAASLTTLLIEFISATDADLTTSIVVHATKTAASADIPAGTVVELGLPLGTPTQRFIGLRFTPVGGAATATVSAGLAPAEMVSIAPQHYAKNYAI